MNPDYEYMLPPHLQLLPHTSSSPGPQLQAFGLTSTVHPAAAPPVPGATIPTHAAASSCPAGLPAQQVGAAFPSPQSCRRTSASAGSPPDADDHADPLDGEAVAACSRAPAVQGVPRPAEEICEVSAAGAATPADERLSFSHGKLSTASAGSRTCGQGAHRSPCAASASRSEAPPVTSAASLAHSQEEEQWLHWQLNQFKKEDVFLGRFRVLGQRHRRRGGAARRECMCNMHMIICDPGSGLAARHGLAMHA